MGPGTGRESRKYEGFTLLYFYSSNVRAGCLTVLVYFCAVFASLRVLRKPFLFKRDS